MCGVYCLNGVFMNVLVELVVFVVVIGVLVVVYEYGYYCVVCWCGVKVLCFLIGFGQFVVCWVSCWMGIEWMLFVLLFGGYVKMFDECDLGFGILFEVFGQVFNCQLVYKCIVIVVVGLIVNFLLVIMLFFFVFVIGVIELIVIVVLLVVGIVVVCVGFDGSEMIVLICNVQGGEFELV